MGRKNGGATAEAEALHEPSPNGTPDPPPDPKPEPEPEARQRPVHEIRLGAVKVAIWANQTDQGVRYAVTHGRLYKREDTGEWHTASNYSRDHIPALTKALELAWLHIYGMQQADGYVPF